MTHINSLPDPLPHTPYLIPPSIPYIDFPAQLLGGSGSDFLSLTHTYPYISTAPPLHSKTSSTVTICPNHHNFVISDPEPTDWTRIEVENQLKTYPESQILTVIGEG